MVDFRRIIPVLAVIAFLLGSVTTASAQPSLTCLANGGVNTPVRAEGLTEEVGDVSITCTGGTATPWGSPVISTVNVQIFLNTSVTSRLMSSSTTLPQISEALLIIDEPAPGNQFGCPNTTCVNLGTGSGVGVYGGGTPGTLGNNKNIFQGLQTASNSITFLGIPIDPPGTSGSRIIRITNIRGNANALGVAGANATPTSVVETITATPQNFLPVSNPVQTVGSVQRGLQFGIFSTTSSTAAFTASGLQQCVSKSETAGAIAVLRYSELFATAFKKRFVSASVANPSGGPPPQQNSLTIGNYNTESGFVNTALTLPANTFSNTTVGLADWGTRLKAVFNNIPNGVNLFVDRLATSGNDQATLTAAEAGAFSAVGPTAVSPVGNTTAQLTIANNSATAVWEVLESDPLAFAVLNFRVWATYTASPATNSPALATATVNGSYAPTSTVTTAQNPLVPRFADTSTANNIFTVIPCATNLLYPYVTTQAGFDTGIAISATSIDPFGTSGQSGTCTLNWYGAAFTGATPTPVVNAGTTYSTLVSSTLSNVTGGFTGYMIAVCRFQYAHGFAFISDLGARNLAMGYLALIIPDPARSSAGGNGANPFPFSTTNSGEQLGY